MSIVLSDHSIEPYWKSGQLPMLAPFLPDSAILQALKTLRHCWRTSACQPIDVVWSMIYRALHPDHSIANAVEHLAACGISITDSGWCQARSRLPVDLFPFLSRQTAWSAVRSCASRFRWHGRDVFIVDGTTVSMPDTPELVEVFGYADGRYGPSKFPVARVVGILHAGSHAVTDYRIAP
jgi:hypothetical protein